MKEIFIRISAVVAAVLGLFPATNPWAKPADLKFKYSHPAFFLGLILPAFQLVVLSDVFISGPPESLGEYNTTYKKITYYSIIAFPLVISTLCQLIGLFTCSSTIQICQTLTLIQKQLHQQYLSHSSKTSQAKYIIILAAAITFYLYTAFDAAKEATNNGNSDLKDFQLKLRSTIFADDDLLKFVILLSQFVFRSVGNTVFVQLTLGGFWLTDSQNLVHKSILMKMEHLSETAESTCICYKCPLHTLHVDKNGDQIKELFPELTTKVVKEYWELIQNLKHAHDYYLGVAGWYLLVFLTYGVADVTIGLSVLLIDPKKIERLAGIPYIATCVAIFVALGEFMQKSIRRNQEELRNKIKALSMEGKCPKNWKTCCSAFINWKWELSAHNVFVVDHRLITGVLSSMFTVTIFLFQLRNAEGLTSQP